MESPPEGLQKDALSDIFSWDGRWGVGRQTIPGGGRNGGVNKIIKVEPGKSDFDIDRVVAGFRVSCPTGMTAGGPLTARLQAAYAVPRGNPLPKYREPDFRLHGDAAQPATLTVTVQGGSYRPGSKGNELLLNIADPAHFVLTVQGFGSQRDVYVQVTRDYSPPAGEEVE